MTKFIVKWEVETNNAYNGGWGPDVITTWKEFDNISEVEEWISKIYTSGRNQGTMDIFEIKGERQIVPITKTREEIVGVTIK